MRRLCDLGRAIVIAGAATLALTGVIAVSAHARYVSSSPAQEQVLPTSPARVDINTAQDMAKLPGVTQITVTNEQGQQVDKGDTTIDDNNRRHFYVDLQPNLPPGRYLVSFKNQSDEDGEQDHGQFAFYIGQGPTPQQKAEDAKLAITSQDEGSGGSSGSGNNTKVGIAIVVTLLAAALIPAVALISSAGKRSRA